MTAWLWMTDVARRARRGVGFIQRLVVGLGKVSCLRHSRQHPRRPAWRAKVSRMAFARGASPVGVSLDAHQGRGFRGRLA